LHSIAGLRPQASGVRALALPPGNSTGSASWRKVPRLIRRPIRPFGLRRVQPAASKCSLPERNRLPVTQTSTVISLLASAGRKRNSLLHARSSCWPDTRRPGLETLGAGLDPCPDQVTQTRSSLATDAQCRRPGPECRRRARQQLAIPFAGELPARARPDERRTVKTDSCCREWSPLFRRARTRRHSDRGAHRP
jgi:hypothetical protein